MTEPFSPLPTAPDAPVRYAVSSQLLHDLRTPLHQIIGYSEMLAEQAQLEEQGELSADLQKMRAAGRQLLSLLDLHFTAQRQSQTQSQRPAQSAPERSEESGFTGNFTGNFEALAPASSLTAARGALSPRETLGDDDLALGAGQGRILVVDDNETNREVLLRLLSRHKYQAEAVDGGAEALERVREQDFDVVLLDIMMPHMDGYAVLEALKADDATRALPVIMISALGEIDSVVRCIELGAEDYLPKPFNPTLLRARISACLEKKRGRDREMRLFAQLQENYRRLQALEVMRDDLTHMIVHDLRTPLSSLLAGLQTMPMVAPLLEAQQECLDIAMRGGFALLDLINDLLDISKIESGEMQLQLAPVEVAELIKSACNQVAASAFSRDLSLGREIEPDLPPIRVDEDKIRRTLVNLLGNALKFTPRGGTITLSARGVENGTTLFSVRDTGEGIPAADFARIFDKFAQVENRRAERHMSTGLGLALCKMVVETHGGQIWVESELGQGSTFFFTVPREIGR